MGLFSNMTFDEAPASEPAAPAATPAPTSADLPAEGETPVSFSALQEARQATLEAGLRATGYVPPPRLARVFQTPASAPEEGFDVTPGGLEQLRKDEGERLRPYKDTKGITTVGVGFNLEDPANHSVFRDVVGVDPAAFIRQGMALTPAQSKELLDITSERAARDARMLVPNFDTLPSAAQDALTNFVFNVGMKTASQFKNTLAAINRGDGKAAAAGIRNSAYYKQVGQRGERVAKALENLQDPQPDQQPAIDPATAAEAAAAAGAGTVVQAKAPEAIKTGNAMLKAGASADEVFKATGLYHAHDGQWLELLSDKASRVQGQLTEEPQRLSAVFANQELEKRYPELFRTVTVKLETNPAASGVFFPATNTITITPGQSPEEIRKTLIHEVQHAVQKWDNRPGGGNEDSHFLPKQWAKSNLTAGEIAKNKKIGNDLMDALAPAWLDMLQQDRDAIVDAQQFGVVTEDLADMATTMLGEQEAGLGDPMPKAAIKALQRITENSSPTASRKEMYWRLPGEAEARFAETHADKTLEELKALGLPEDNFDRAKALLTKFERIAAKAATRIRP